MKTIIDELEWRGLIKQLSDKGKLLESQKNKKAIYCGFDPTAQSLHVGHLIQIMLLKRFSDFGFKPIALLGGATGMVGDPSGKNQERILLDEKSIMNFTSSINNQLNKFLKNIIILNNLEWYANFKFLNFLRDYGKSFNIAYLLSKDIISKRIDSGISYTEFSYNLLQAYDFFHLYKNYECDVQIGGSDQWGNITSGLELIKKQEGINNTSSGVTIQLLLKKDGLKFGKTGTNTIWLDPNLTSSYEFYQFFLNQEDSEVEQLLKFLTFYTEEEIEDILSEHNKNVKARHAQLKLAEAVLLFVYDEKELLKVKKITEALFTDQFDSLTEEELKLLGQSIEKYQLSDEQNILDLLCNSKIAQSKREAREFINNNSIRVNSKIITDEKMSINKLTFFHNHYLILKKGKKKHFLIIK
ncbi:tyrosine--tRNA ligase [Spiroplasma endosymbiont of Amphibalanus improvisus]|uniref:tyrosine--tRNA ligase n=1 Tax=Spiroplasma endosymbiont of Amphibalanus improvisus TaxID=3066327 RepID=UPI00313B8E4B